MQFVVLSRGLTGLVFTFILALSACGSTAPQAVQQGAVSPPFTIRLHADRIVLSKPEDVCNASLLVDGIVGSHGPSRWNSNDGKRPNLATSSEVVRQGHYIYTPVTFSQFTRLQEKDKSVANLYYTLGGAVGQDSYFIDEEPQLEDRSHHLIVFTPPGPHKGPPTGNVLLTSYAYPFTPQGKIALQQAGDPNEPGTGPVQPEISITLTDLKQLRANCKA
jgi:hypothetical protein